VAAIVMMTVELKLILSTTILPRKLTSLVEMLENLPLTKFV
jgi:hypothetical protein